jgi:hypothetical protein
MGKHQTSRFLPSFNASTSSSLPYFSGRNSGDGLERSRHVLLVRGWIWRHFKFCETSHLSLLYAYPWFGYGVGCPSVLLLPHLHYKTGGTLVLHFHLLGE